MFDLDASTGHQVPAGITCRSEELLAGTLVERLTYDPNLTTGAYLLREATLIQEIIVTHSDVEDAEDARCA